LAVKKELNGMADLQKHRFLIWIFSILFLSPVFAQKNKQPAKPVQQTKPQVQTIKIDHANKLLHDPKVANGAQRLIGNVEIEDDSTHMFCDSAYVFTDNSFNAYNHVHMQRKDSVNLYGDSLHYNGNTKRAEMFGKISFKQKAMTLTTHHLIYSVDSSYAHYWDGGTLIDSATTLVSELGTYNSKARMAYFKNKVLLTNPDYTVKCDTMNYDPSATTSYFFGPTYITNKDNFMYCEHGYYSSSKSISQFSQHAYMKGKKGETLRGDQIFYNRKKEFGQALDNVSLEDTTDNITIKGDYAYYNGYNKTMLVTCHALMMQKFDKDTLYLHSDTLFGYNISMSDTNTGKNKTPKLLLAYHHVKLYKKDMQGKCDSLTYNEKDSTMRMFYSPVLWSEVNQLTADTMKLYMKNQRMDKMDMRSNAFIISKDTAASKNDSLQYNQIKGKNMRAFFVNNKIYKVDVKGNSQTIYYVYSDNNTQIIGANRADCSNMLIFIRDNRVKSITFLDKPDATLFPKKDIKISDFLLKDFIWRDSERPHKLLDIFGDER